jgi:hypothetical protein
VCAHGGAAARASDHGGEGAVKELVEKVPEVEGDRQDWLPGRVGDVAEGSEGVGKRGLHLLRPFAPDARACRLPQPEATLTDTTGSRPAPSALGPGDVKRPGEIASPAGSRS